MTRRRMNLHLQSLTTSLLICLALLFNLNAYYFIFHFPSTQERNEQWLFEHHDEIKEGHAPSRKIELPVNCSNWEESTACHKLWRGLPSLNNNNDDNHKLSMIKKVNISVVISYCDTDNDDSMRLFKGYINREHVSIKDITIIHRCSGGLDNVDTDGFAKKATIVSMKDEEDMHPRASFTRWLSKYKYAPTAEMPMPNDSHIVLFLSSESIKKLNKRRSMYDLILATMQYGFGCVVKPLDYTQSIYHNETILRTFKSMTQQSEEAAPRNLGNWLDDIGISMNGYGSLTPVCYSDSFAIKASDIPSKRQLFLAITKDLENKNNSASTEAHEFLERSLAAIFSYPLEKSIESSLVNHADQMEQKTCCYTGVLTSTYIKPVPPIWTGDAPLKNDIDLSKLHISLVLSFCDEDITWMKKYINNVKIEKTIIFSKCNYTIQDTSSTMPFFGNNVTIVELPNVGRCDHSYAHYMGQIMEESEANDNHVVLFMKASRLLHQSDSHARTIQDMTRIAYYSGLGCGIEISSIYSIYYYTADVRNFEKKNYKDRKIGSTYKNFGDWLDKLEIELPTPLVPLCYSGFFAVKASRIIGLRKIWKKMEQSLSRGNDIEEGHFAERTWAALLMNPLTPIQIEELERVATGKTPTYRHYSGALNSVDF